MTNEQKIQKLKVFRDNGKVLLDPCLIDKDRLWKEMTEVFDMAIEALQLQQDCKAMDDSIDCISRQEALNIRFSDAINNDGVLYVPLRDFTDGLKTLPSAQSEIIHCRDCKHHWTYRCMGDFPTEACELEQTFYDANVDFCSLAERRTDEGSD